jgi:polar amino acid transport system substrate-binding protein
LFVIRYSWLTPYFHFLAVAWWAASLAACTGSSPTPIPTFTPVPPTQSMATVRLANGEWPPYNGQALPHYGCDSQVVAEAFALEGITVEYGFFPWARSYWLSASGAWDGTVAWADTPEHRQQHYVSAEPTSIQKWVFFYRKDRPFSWETMDDLTGKTIGTTTGYVYSDVFKDLEQKGTATFEETSSDVANFKMLLAGRIDVFPMEYRVGYTILKSSFTAEEQAQITTSPKALTEFRPVMLLSRAVPLNAQRMELFNQGWQHLQASGRYTEIMQGCAP